MENCRTWGNFLSLPCLFFEQTLKRLFSISSPSGPSPLISPPRFEEKSLGSFILRHSCKVSSEMMDAWSERWEVILIDIHHLCLNNNDTVILTISSWILRRRPGLVWSDGGPHNTLRPGSLITLFRASKSQELPKPWLSHNCDWCLVLPRSPQTRD